MGVDWLLGAPPGYGALSRAVKRHLKAHYDLPPEEYREKWGLPPDIRWSHSADAFGLLFAVNTIGPALAAKHFLPKLKRGERAIFAALSARVGSISDNRLGGWYAYRASKAALNMIVRTAAIETARRAPQAIIVGLHPGTVDSRLSKPFQGNASARTIFEPASAASQLLGVLEGLRPEDSGKCFAYDGQEVLP